MNIIDQFKRSSSRGEFFVDDENAFSHLETPRVKLIAYYLPQFHPIPENDDWWGKGFTEWRNVTKSMPRFEGHYQPHLPGSLGFYDLRIPDVLREQARLAKKYGIEAFCFHRYWFNGKTLLETPLKIFLENPDIDIKFCLNWANENWSRRWNGGDRDILIAQKHSAEDDIAFAKSLEPFLRDKRYLRVGDRPLIMIYRPGILPDGAATVQRWREHFASAGSPDPYIVMAQTGDVDPRPYGIDAAAGFPPHNATAGLKDHSSAMRFFSREPFGRVYDYNEMADLAISNNPKDFNLFPGVCPGWDSTPRYGGGGAACFHGAQPEAYGRWLEAACQNVRQIPNKDEHIVFINAWNEWAEGAHLEPDLHFGYGYLNETRRVLERLRPEPISADRRKSYDEINKEFVYRSSKTRLPIFYRMIRKARNLAAAGTQHLTDLLRMQ